MDASDPEPSSSLSLSQVLAEIESLIDFERTKCSKAWVHANDLAQEFWKRHGIWLDSFAKAQGYSGGLRHLLTSSRHFAVYGTQIHQEFYVALLKSVSPGSRCAQAAPIKYQVKRPWKVDGRLLKMLKNEGAERISLKQQKSATSDSSSLLLQGYKDKGNQPHEICSLEDLERALVGIIKDLITSNPGTVVTIGLLSKKFRDRYNQPIRVAVRSLSTGMSLVELLQTVPGLLVQQLADEWQITVETMP